jgi:anti-sigma B factor antagonist
MAVRVSSPGAGRGSSTESASRRPATSNGQRPFADRMFVAATERLDNGTPVVRVMGEVDLATVPALEKALLGVGDRTGAVIVDLTGCTFLESSGLRALVATRGRLQRSNRRMALVLSTPTVLRVFEITGLDELFEIYPSLGAASTAMATAIAPGGSSTDAAQHESTRG